MKVFISWSGEKSKAVGELLSDWLQCVLQVIDPWMSSKDIDRGSLWFSEITDQLKDTSIGIICLTQENKDKPWILFEAGALAKGLSSNRVCTLLIDLTPTDIKDPLAQFNHTIPDKDGIWSLVRTLNTRLGDNSLKEKILQNVFETYWPQFLEKFSKIQDEILVDANVIKRNNDDILLEILTSTRNLDKRLRNVELKNDDMTIVSSSGMRDNLKNSSFQTYYVNDFKNSSLPTNLKENDKRNKDISNNIKLVWELDNNGNIKEPSIG